MSLRSFAVELKLHRGWPGSGAGAPSIECHFGLLIYLSDWVRIEHGLFPSVTILGQSEPVQFIDIYLCNEVLQPLPLTERRVRLDQVVLSKTK